MSHSSDAPPRVWNVCVAHQPCHAGLYRGIRDFVKALRGGVLSFGESPGVTTGDHPDDVVVRVPCGRGWLERECHTLSRDTVRAADHIGNGADLLVAHSLFRAHCPWARDWAIRHRRPFWVVPHGCLDPAGLAHRGLLKRAWLRHHGRFLFADADRVVFATQRERDKAARWLGPKSRGPSGEARTAVVPWPVDLPLQADAADARSAFRLRCRIPENAKILLFVGRLHSTKRPLDTIRLFCRANPAACHLVMVGMDEQFTRAQLENSVPEDFRNRIHVVGELHGARLAEAWMAADGYVSLSLKENFGYALAEALAHGLPVIVSPGHDLAYELPRSTAHGLASGWLLPDMTARAAIEALRAWADLVQGNAAEQKLAAIRDAARQWVADNLSFTRFQATLGDLAADAVRRH